jgi:hypothetical protein
MYIDCHEIMASHADSHRSVTNLIKQSALGLPPGRHVADPVSMLITITNAFHSTSPNARRLDRPPRRQVWPREAPASGKHRSPIPARLCTFEPDRPPRCRTAARRAVIKGSPHRWQSRPRPPRQRRDRIFMHRQHSRELTLLPLLARSSLGHGASVRAATASKIAVTSVLDSAMSAR